MKKLFIVAGLALGTISVTAQSLRSEAPQVYSKTIGISSGIMAFSPGWSFLYPTSQLGFTYERKVYKSFFISGGLYFWNNNSNELSHDFETGKLTLYENRPWAPNALERRMSYKTIELVPEYKLHSRNYKDILTLGLGLSYTFGTNSYIQDNRPQGYQPGDEFPIAYSNSSTAYFGAVTKAAYTHFFFHNRIGIGAEARYRYYFGLNEGEYDLDANLKFNF